MVKIYCDMCGAELTDATTIRFSGHITHGRRILFGERRIPIEDLKVDMCETCARKFIRQEQIDEAIRKIEEADKRAAERRARREAEPLTTARITPEATEAINRFMEEHK